MVFINFHWILPWTLRDYCERRRNLRHNYVKGLAMPMKSLELRSLYCWLYHIICWQLLSTYYEESFWLFKYFTFFLESSIKPTMFGHLWVWFRWLPNMTRKHTWKFTFRGFDSCRSKEIWADFRFKPSRSASQGSLSESVSIWYSQSVSSQKICCAEVEVIFAVPYNAFISPPPKDALKQTMTEKLKAACAVTILVHWSWKGCLCSVYCICWICW